MYWLRLRSAPLYEWVEIWYVGSLWPSQTVFSIQLEHNTGQGHLRSSGKKGHPPEKNRDMALQYMFIGQLFAKNTKNDKKNTFWEIKFGQKIKIGKSRENGQIWLFQHVLCHNSAIFEDIDLNFCTRIHQPLPSNILYAFFANFVMKEKKFRKYKILRNVFDFFGIFIIWQIRDSSFVALLILCHILYDNWS